VRAVPHFASGAADGPDPGAYADRIRAPAETVRRIWPYLGELGITRLARQTGLDRVGIPCWAAFRPNSRNLAGAQGKGLSDAAACASAAMEALEAAIAEAPATPSCRASADMLAARREAWFDPERLLPFGTTLTRTVPITWLAGIDLASGRPVWVPRDGVDMDGEQSELAGICKTSNGLASGNSRDEAIFHGLCELIERDATTLWSFLSEAQALGTAIAASAFADAAVTRLADRVAAAGLRLALFDHTSDLGVPVVMAVLGPDRPGFVGELEVTAGYGAHPVAARAALRAITEAAQSRVTSIAAARDDIHSAAFDAAAAPVNRRLLAAASVAPAPVGLPLGTPLPALLAHLTARLAAAGIGVVAVDLAPPDRPYAVVKLVSADLEDRAANINWRPGWRSFDALARS
jgi:ribosomal protein S12 methylthiotransferase accessory factor